MKMIKKIALAAAGLALTGSSVFAQSLDDAKKAIDAEQFQKAKAMLKNLTVTQPTNDEAFFQLGWVYLSQDYADSAKATFNKGIAANPKSALNYVGLGVAAQSAKDQATATSSFSTALANAKKKDAKPYVYIARGYLLDAVDGRIPADKFTLAVDALNKGKVVDPKDADVLIELGNAYRSQLNSNAAYDNYSQALAIDPKSVTANTAIGVLWRFADNFAEAEKQFKAALAIDPNFGPAYREWAETNLREARSNRKVASEKIKAGVEHYKTYLSLTDESLESLMRYADFLVSAGDYATLQEVGKKLAGSANANARIYRYLGYAAYETKDYPTALKNLNTWFEKAGPTRILPRDYLYLGKSLIDSKQDTTKGLENLTKAIELDSSFADVYRDIAGVYRTQRKYTAAGDAYSALLKKSKSLTLGDYANVGNLYYYAFNFEQAGKVKTTPGFKQDSTLLTKADTALAYAQSKVSSPVASIPLTRARIADLREGADRNNIKGLARPFYEQVIQISEPKAASLTGPDKSGLVEAYDYMGALYGYKEKDDVKAAEYFNKAKALDPNDKPSAFYFSQKSGSKSK